jgi:hypothetical protein
MAGDSTMRRPHHSFLLLLAGMALLAIPPAQAEEHKHPAAAQAADSKPKEEARNAFPLGTRGTANGVILGIEQKKGTVVLQTKDGNLLFTPIWRGGSGGGLDKGMIERVATFKVGDKVRIAWSWEDRRRIESISAGE